MCPQISKYASQQKTKIHPSLQRGEILVQFTIILLKHLPIKHNVHTTQYVGNLEKQDLVFVLSVTKATRDDCLSFYFVLVCRPCQSKVIRLLTVFWCLKMTTLISYFDQYQNDKLVVVTPMTRSYRYNSLKYHKYRCDASLQFFRQIH